MPPTGNTTMATGRGILTDGEYRYLRGDEGDQRRYEARSRVRARINQVVTEDVEFLAEHEPDLLEELRDVVCRDEGE